MSEVFHLTHDANDWSEYDTAPAGGGGLSLSAAAGLDGSAYGVVIDGNGADRHADKDFTGISGSATELRLGFYIDLNNLTLTTGIDDDMRFMHWTPLTEQGTDLFVKNAGPGIFVRADVGYDGFGSSVLDTNVFGAGEHTIEIAVTKAATGISSDGTAILFVDGVSKDSASGIDNFDTFADWASALTELLVENIVSFATVTGTMFVDEIILRDDSTPIYPGAFSGFDLVIGGGLP